MEKIKSMDPFLRKHVGSYIGFCVIMLAVIFVVAFLGGSFSLMACWASPDPIEASCYINDIKVVPVLFTNGCGEATVNYYIYLFTSIQTPSNTTISSGICNYDWCVYASDGICYASECGEWDGCGPVVTTDDQTYLDMLHQNVDCWYIEAPEETNDYKTVLNYWAFLYKPSCNNFWNISMFVILCLSILVLFLSPGYLVLVYFRYQQVKSQGYIPEATDNEHEFYNSSYGTT